MPVFDLAVIAAAGVQVGLIGTAAFAVTVLIWGLHKAKRAL